MKRVTLAGVMVFALLFAPCAQAGVFGNFWAAVGKAVEDYNADMLATGDAVNAALKDGKIMDAFTAYEQNIQVVGDHALANSKAVYAALKEIVMWIPNQLKKIWDKFVEILQKIRDALAALNQPGGGIIPAARTKASQIYAPSTRASRTTRGWMDNFDFKPVDSDEEEEEAEEPTTEPTLPQNFKGLGDGWVELFEQHGDLSAKLKTFTQYRGHCHTMGLWMKSLDKEKLEALAPQFTKVTAECATVEDSLFNEISASLEDDGAKMKEYTNFLKAMPKDEAEVLLGGLTKKLSRRMKMVSRSRGTSKTFSKMNTDFSAAKKTVGLK